MRPPRRLIPVLLGSLAVVLMSARLSDGAQAQSGPFPTVPAPNATFPAPVQPGATAQPWFVPVDLQPRLRLGDRIGEAAGYLAGAGIALALGGAALWLDRRAAKTGRVTASASLGRLGTGRGRFSFRPRFRRMAWIAPSAAGLALLALGASKCVPPKICYATVGGLQVVVPCGQVEGVVEEQVTATATPGIDCPDPGRGGTNAYEVARAGGTHSGYLRQAEGFSDINLHRALRSYELQVAYHAGKIANPSGQLLDTPWDIMDSDEQRRVLTDWCTDLGRNRELADVILGILRERGISP